MSNKKADAIDTNVEGHGFDGFWYALDLVGNKTVRVADADDIGRVWARIKQAKEKNEDVEFSGVHLTEEQDGRVLVGKRDGLAIYPAAAIVGIRNGGPNADSHEQAYDAARAYFEVHAEALTAMPDESMLGGGNPVPAQASVPTVIGGDDDEDE